MGAWRDHPPPPPVAGRGFGNEEGPRADTPGPSANQPCSTHGVAVQIVPAVEAQVNPPDGGALGNSRTTFSPQVRGHKSGVQILRRNARYGQRAKLRKLTTIPRLGRCGWTPRGAEVEVKSNGELAHFAGLKVCGLVWVCPVCAPKIRQARAEEIGSALRSAIDQGMGVEFLTLTFRHHAGQSLAQLLDADAKAWNSTIKSRPLRAALQALGYLGLVQAHEVTHGRNGWHPHRHISLLFARPLTDNERGDLEDLIWRTWDGRLRRQGLSSLRGPGTVLKRCTAAEGLGWYLTKVDGKTALGLEMARADLKTGRLGGRTPQELLADALDGGEARDVHLWKEYEQATFGRKLITWTPGLRKQLVDQADEVEDQELAEATVGGEVMAVLELPAWRIVRTASPGGVEALQAAEAGRATLEAYLRSTVPAGGWWMREGAGEVPPPQNCGHQA